MSATADRAAAGPMNASARSRNRVWMPNAPPWLGAGTLHQFDAECREDEAEAKPGVCAAHLRRKRRGGQPDHRQPDRLQRQRGAAGNIEAGVAVTPHDAEAPVIDSVSAPIRKPPVSLESPAALPLLSISVHAPKPVVQRAKRSAFPATKTQADRPKPTRLSISTIIIRQAKRLPISRKIKTAFQEGLQKIRHHQLHQEPQYNRKYYHRIRIRLDEWRHQQTYAMYHQQHVQWHLCTSEKYHRSFPQSTRRGPLEVTLYVRPPDKSGSTPR